MWLLENLKYYLHWVINIFSDVSIYHKLSVSGENLITYWIIKGKEIKEAKLEEEKERKENEEEEAKKEKPKPGFDGNWYTDINEE